MSSEPDIVYRLRSGLTRIVEIKPVDDYVRVTTHCLYPSNGLVTVSVRAGNDSAMISDEGGALAEALSAGVVARPSDKQLARLIESRGLSISNGMIFSPRVPIESVHLTVLIVANAAKDVAEWLYANSKIRPVRDFKKALTQLLERMFERDLVPGGDTIRGKYKSHKFAHVVRLGGGRRLIVDPVEREQSSINARVVSNLDVKQLDDQTVIQRIVYDDSVEWKPDDLALLGMADIPLVAFSRSSEVMRRFVDHAP